MVKFRIFVLRWLSYSTVYLLLNLIMQFIIKAIVLIADLDILANLAHKKDLLVLINMFVTASLYGGLLGNLEGSLERVVKKVLAFVSYFGSVYFGIFGSLFFIYYFIFAGYYWVLFSENILPAFITNSVYWVYSFILSTITGFFTK